MKNQAHKLWIAACVILCSVFAISLSQLNAIDRSQIKEKIDDISQALQKEVDRLGDDMRAVQDYLTHYHWKGLIQDQVIVGPATVGQLHLNGHSRAVAVLPGERIEGEITCSLDPKKASKLSYYRVVIGLKGVGPHTTACHCLGAAAGKTTTDKFVLIAPQARGIYQVRFRLTENFTESESLKHWLDDQGQEPDATHTIGVIVVK